jgi:hypothetical protein
VNAAGNESLNVVDGIMPSVDPSKLSASAIRAVRERRPALPPPPPTRFCWQADDAAGANPVARGNPYAERRPHHRAGVPATNTLHPPSTMNEGLLPDGVMPAAPDVANCALGGDGDRLLSAAVGAPPTPSTASRRTPLGRERATPWGMKWPDGRANPTTLISGQTFTVGNTILPSSPADREQRIGRGERRASREASTEPPPPRRRESSPGAGAPGDTPRLHRLRRPRRACCLRHEPTSGGGVTITGQSAASTRVDIYCRRNANNESPNVVDGGSRGAPPGMRETSVPACRARDGRGRRRNVGAADPSRASTRRTARPTR